MPTNNLRDLLYGWSKSLQTAGVATPAVDAALLAAHVLDVGRGELDAMAIMGRQIDESQVTAIDQFVDRRVQREPLQHILGVAYFYGLELAVGSGVFTPRPETELLVDRVLAAMPNNARVVDLGTGSGAIALAIARARPDAQVFAVERDVAALTWTRKNLATFNLPNLSLIEGSFLDEQQVWSSLASVDVVVSNPPYVPSEAIPVDPEVRDHDPAAALYSGADGLDDIRGIAALSARFLADDGALWLEHYETQGPSVRALLANAGFAAATTLPDLSGRDRFTFARLPLNRHLTSSMR